MSVRDGQADVRIRLLQPADWPRIYPFFAAIVAAGETLPYPESLGPDEARRYWVAEPPGRTVVAENDRAVAATATMGPNRPGRGAHVASATFMVDPAHHGRGIGRALGEYVIDWARAEGYRAIQFNAVVETNAAAVHLWQSLGFVVLATVPEAFAHPTHGFVGLHVMHKPLA